MPPDSSTRGRQAGDEKGKRRPSQESLGEKRHKGPAWGGGDGTRVGRRTMMLALVEKPGRRRKRSNRVEDGAEGGEGDGDGVHTTSRPFR